MNATTVLLNVDIVRTVGWVLCHFIWQGTGIGAVTWVVLAALRRADSQLRHAVLSGALALLLLAPVATAAVLVVGSGGSSADASGFTLTIAEEIQTLPVVLVSYLLNPGRLADAAIPYLVAAWLLGVALLGIRRVGGGLLLRRMRRDAELAGALWQEKARELGSRLGLRRAVPLLCSAHVDTAAVIGWLRPIILLPASAVFGLSPDDLESILLHELSHIERHDHLMNALQSMAEWLLFYHPAVWWVSAQLRVEREFCCDDRVISLGCQRAAYGRALARLEGLRLPVSAVAVAATDGNLLRRIRRLARPDAARSAPSASLAMGAMSGAVLLAALVFSVDPGGALGRGDRQEAAAGASAEAAQSVHVLREDWVPSVGLRARVRLRTDGTWALDVMSGPTPADSSWQHTGDTFEQLSGRLTEAGVAGAGRRLIVITADSSVAHRDVTRVMDLARSAGFVDQVIAVDPAIVDRRAIASGAEKQDYGGQHRHDPQRRAEQGRSAITDPPYTLAYEVRQLAQVRVVLYDPSGSQVRELRNERAMPGTYRVEWDGLQADGGAAPPGVYFYKLTVGTNQHVLKVSHQ